MLNETSFIRDNIKKIRKFLNESSDRGNIADAIDNKKILAIHYAGDNTVRRGYRTVEPHAMGTILKKNKDTGNMEATGGLAVRAWEQAGQSDTYRNPPVGRWARNPRRKDHEYWENDQGGKPINPGWRLFKMDGISNILYTGEEFAVRDSFRANDKQLSVDKEVKRDSQSGSQEVDGIESIDVADVLKQKLSAFNTQSDKWKTDAKDSEEKLIRDIISYQQMLGKEEKKGLGDYDIFNSDGKNYAIRRISKEYPQWQKGANNLGNLKDLVNKYSEPDWKDKTFFQKIASAADIANRKAEKINV